MQNTTIKNWAQDDRPREKMLLKNADALSNAELIAILINNGTKNKSAVDVAKELLQKTDNDLLKLGKLTVKEIVKLKVKGIGEAKAISIVAALELGTRREASDKKKEKIITSKDAAEFLKAKLQHKKHEAFVVIFLNAANRVIHFEIVSEGGITGTVADPRIIMRKAVEHDAVNIVLSHNHPSGSLKPSKSDKELTHKIKEAAKYFDITVIDHVIVSENGYFSFADEGLM